MKKNRLICLFMSIALVSLLLTGCSSDSDSNNRDVIGDLKEVVFHSYGNQTLEEAVNSALTDVEWAFDDNPDFDGGILYNAALQGNVPDDGSTVYLEFTVLYKYRQTSDSPQDIEVSVTAAAIDDMPVDDLNAVMNWIYGNFTD